MNILSLEKILQVSGGENNVAYEFTIYASYFEKFEPYLSQYKNNQITAEQLVSASYYYSAPNHSGLATVTISV